MRAGGNGSGGGAGSLIRWAGLWKKQGATGHQYLVGRVAGLRLVITANRDRQGDDDPTHLLWVAPAGERRAGTADRAPPLRRAYANQKGNRTAPSGNGRPFNDPVDDVGGGQ